MKRILKLMMLILPFILFGCGETTGEPYVILPEAPLRMFRGGAGRIRIRYTPPPDPIFRIARGTTAKPINLKEIPPGQIPEVPFTVIVSITPEGYVNEVARIEPTDKPIFDKMCIDAIRSWKYERYGSGQLKIQIIAHNELIRVNASGIQLVPPIPGRPDPKIGSPPELVLQVGFGKILEW